MDIGTFNHLLFWFAILTLVWNVYFVVFNRGIPNIRTAPAIRKKIIEMLKEDRAKRGGGSYVIYDIGSGNGLFTREIAQAMPEAKVIGIEISPQQYRWAMMMKRRKKLDNLDYKKADFFTCDVSDASAVVMFFMQTDKVAKQLRTMLKPGTLVTSNKFPLGDGWKPQELLKVRTWYPFQKKLYIYRSP